MTNLFKHLVFTFFLVGVFLSDSQAQKGNNVVSISAETAMPIFQSNVGYGIIIKGLYGIGKNGQLTLSGGVSKFNSKKVVGNDQRETMLIPFLFGYRQNIKKFFIEPRIGLGELSGKIAIDGDYSRPSVAALFGGIVAGYAIKRINLGISFITAKGIENSSAGIWYNKSFQCTSIFISYDLFSKLRE
jgi:hypothetical protein